MEKKLELEKRLENVQSVLGTGQTTKKSKPGKRHHSLVVFPVDLAGAGVGSLLWMDVGTPGCLVIGQCALGLAPPTDTDCSRHQDSYSFSTLQCMSCRQKFADVVFNLRSRYWSFF